MWTAQIVSKDVEKSRLLIGVRFDNGIKTFSESMDMSGGTFEGLTTRISQELNTLNANDTLLVALMGKDETELQIQIPVETPVEAK